MRTENAQDVTAFLTIHSGLLVYDEVLSEFFSDCQKLLEANELAEGKFPNMT